MMFASVSIMEDLLTTIMPMKQPFRLVVFFNSIDCARLELSIHPLFEHSTYMYIRIYVKVKLSSSQASRVYDAISAICDTVLNVEIESE